MNTTKNFKMVDISNTILPKEVQNEIMEARERRGPFEKNTALKRMVGKKPVVTGGHIQTIITWIVGLSIIGIIIWGTVAGHGGY